MGYIKKSWIEKLKDSHPGGVAGQKKLLEREGHKVIKKGKKYLVL